MLGHFCGWYRRCCTGTGNLPHIFSFFSMSAANEAPRRMRFAYAAIDCGYGSEENQDAGCYQMRDGLDRQDD